MPCGSSTVFTENQWTKDKETVGGFEIERRWAGKEGFDFEDKDLGAHLGTDKVVGRGGHFSWSPRAGQKRWWGPVRRQWQRLPKGERTHVAPYLQQSRHLEREETFTLIWAILPIFPMKQEKWFVWGLKHVTKENVIVPPNQLASNQVWCVR